MHVFLNDIDSRVFGQNVLSIEQFSLEDNFASFECAYQQMYNPLYVSCKVPLENISDIHNLENHGFQLIECQIRSQIKLRQHYDTSAFPYLFEEVTSEEQLPEVMEIARTTFVHDRLSIDPAIPSHISGERYQQYILKSFTATDEAIYRLIEKETGKTLAFKTHKYLDANNVQFLLGGVYPAYKKLGIGVVNAYFELNLLRNKGIRRGITHISAINYPVMNIEVSHLGFQVIGTFAVMRKIYV